MADKVCTFYVFDNYHVTSIVMEHFKIFVCGEVFGTTSEFQPRESGRIGSFRVRYTLCVFHVICFVNSFRKNIHRVQLLSIIVLLRS